MPSPKERELTYQREIFKKLKSAMAILLFIISKGNTMPDPTLSKGFEASDSTLSKESLKWQ